MASRGDEGRDRLRYALASRQIGFDPAISEWGNPPEVMFRYLITEYIGFGRQTRGIETSKYPKEEKSTEIPSVAASERRLAQTGHIRVTGVVGPTYVIHTC